MRYSLQSSLQILERSPGVLHTLLAGLEDAWIYQNEGPETWSVYDVIGHLIHAEKTDWMVRVSLILSDNEDKRFVPFDRFDHFEDSKGKDMAQLLDEFDHLRIENLLKLEAKKLTQTDEFKTGIHPDFGSVTLSQLISTWVVHDLNHIAQICRVLAKQYKEATGPWVAYLKILRTE